MSVPTVKEFKNAQHIINGYKLCAKCKEVKTLLDFSYYSKTSTLLQSYCRDCNAGIDRSGYKTSHVDSTKQLDLFDVNKEFASIAPEGVEVTSDEVKIEFTKEEIMAMAMVNQINSYLRQIASGLKFKPNIKGE